MNNSEKSSKMASHNGRFGVFYDKNQINFAQFYKKVSLQICECLQREFPD